MLNIYKYNLIQEIIAIFICVFNYQSDSYESES